MLLLGDSVIVHGGSVFGASVLVLVIMLRIDPPGALRAGGVWSLLLAELAMVSLTWFSTSRVCV